MQITAQEQEMVDVVRKDPKIGRGTCSTVDECYTDAEIVEVIRDEKIASADALLTSLYSMENIWRDQADDALAAGGEEQIWGQVTRESDENREQLDDMFKGYAEP